MFIKRHWTLEKGCRRINVRSTNLRNLGLRPVLHPLPGSSSTIPHDAIGLGDFRDRVQFERDHWLLVLVGVQTLLDRPEPHHRTCYRCKNRDFRHWYNGRYRFLWNDCTNLILQLYRSNMSNRSSGRNKCPQETSPCSPSFSLLPVYYCLRPQPHYEQPLPPYSGPAVECGQ